MLHSYSLVDMDAQLGSPQVSYPQPRTSLLLKLPHELLAKICRHIIPTDRVFVLLLATEGDGEGKAPRDDGLYFDRGYGFPFFQTSFLTVHSTIYEACMSLWLCTSLFRLEMGEQLGPRAHAGFLPDRFIRRIFHCELHIVLPFHPKLLTRRPKAKNITCGAWMMRRMLHRLLAMFTQEGNLRELHLSVRNKCTGFLHVSCADRVPKALRLFVDGPLLLPVVDLAGSIRVQDTEVLFRCNAPAFYFFDQLEQVVERRLVAIVRSLAEGKDDEETTWTVFEEEFGSGIYEEPEREVKKYSVRFSFTSHYKAEHFPKSKALIHNGKWNLIIA